MFGLSKNGRLGRTDTPVESKLDDLFDVEKYIKALSEFIQKCETPMTISIQGDWGTGKTSMMNLVRAELGENVTSIWFNTWQFSQFNMDDALAISMLQTLINGLGLDDEYKSSRLSSKVKEILKTGAKGLAVAAAGTFNESAGSFVNESLSPEIDAGYSNMISTLKDDFQSAIYESLRQHPCSADRIVFFIDDLDRLQPIRAIELLEVLKNFLDCSKCIFVLAIDYDVVVTGIHQKFGGEIGDEKGRSFFDKIIQLPFKMPTAQFNITQYVRNMLTGGNQEQTEDSLSDDEIDRYIDLIKRTVGYNPRSMKRLFNTFELLSIVASEDNTADRDTMRVLFAILCMQLRFDQLYTYFATARSVTPESLLALRKKPAEGEPDLLAKLLDESSMLTSDAAKRKEVRAMRDFVWSLVDALQTDDDEALDKGEFDRFKRLLQLSTITSTNDDDVEEYDDEAAWRMRDYTVSLCIKAVDRAKKEGVNVHVRRRRRDRKTHRMPTETWLERPIGHGIGGLCDVIVHRDPGSDIVTISFELWTNKNSHESGLFQRMFSGNPFGYGETDIFQGFYLWMGDIATVPADPIEEAAEEVSKVLCNIMTTIDRRGEAVNSDAC